MISADRTSGDEVTRAQWKWEKVDRAESRRRTLHCGSPEGSVLRTRPNHINEIITLWLQFQSQFLFLILQLAHRISSRSDAYSFRVYETRWLTRLLPFWWKLFSAVSRAEVWWCNSDFTPKLRHTMNHRIQLSISFELPVRPERIATGGLFQVSH